MLWITTSTDQPAETVMAYGKRNKSRLEALLCNAQLLHHPNQNRHLMYEVRLQGQQNMSALLFNMLLINNAKQSGWGYSGSGRGGVGMQ